MQAKMATLGCVAIFAVDRYNLELKTAPLRPSHDM